MGFNHMSPHHRVSPTKVRSPLYAGSPGALQPHSPYQRTTPQHSPPDQGASPHQMASSPHQFAVQNHIAPYSPYCGTAQGSHSSTGQLRGVLLLVKTLMDLMSTSIYSIIIISITPLVDKCKSCILIGYATRRLLGIVIEYRNSLVFLSFFSQINFSSACICDPPWENRDKGERMGTLK